MKKNRRVIFAVILLFASQVLFGQREDNGADIIRYAEAEYEIGRFSNAIDTLRTSLHNGRLSKGPEIEAFQLLTLSYLAIDSTKRAEQNATIILQKQPWFETRSTDPNQFKELINELKTKKSGLEVTSVSKSPERLYEAPATVILVTEKQIEERGYNDLEQLLHDLPGFDISRGAGVTYSAIYPRGYRSYNNTRMLFLIDGVEQNDQWANVVRMSRQYPITNIKSVEIVYGPASTIYGANAFLCVVSVMTKSSESYIEENNRLGVHGQLALGSYNSKVLDLTSAVQNKNKNISASVSFRYFESDERDLSEYDEFSFSERQNSDFVRSLYLKKLTVGKSTNEDLFNDILNTGDTSHYKIQNDSLIPTDLAIQKAIQFDNKLIRESGVKYANPTKSYYVSGKLKVYDLLIGFEYWNKQEGFGAWYTNLNLGTGTTGQVWSPYNMNMYANYSKDINEKLTFVNFLRYKNNGLKTPTAVTSCKCYAGSNDLLQLIKNRESRYENSYRSIRSNQVRNEMRLIYTASQKFNMISGVDFRSSAVQGDYLRSSDSLGLDAEEYGDYTISNSNHFFSTDIGIYSQANWNITTKLKLTGGLRFDHHTGRGSKGYNVFNPRLAGIYHNDKNVYKIIYAEAFMDPTNFEKYALIGNRKVANANLSPEKVRNIELSYRRFINENLNIEVSPYIAFYSNAVKEINTSDTTDNPAWTQFQNKGVRQIFGVFANVWYSRSNIWHSNDKLTGYLNYTYTSPLEIEGENKTKIPDIAEHQVNLGVNYDFNNKFNINLRSNIVGRKTPLESTTFLGYPKDLSKFDPYAILNMTIGYRFFEKKMQAQLIVNNLLNKEYYSPGIRGAENDTYAYYFPQNERTIMLRMTFSF